MARRGRRVGAVLVLCACLSLWTSTIAAAQPARADGAGPHQRIAGAASGTVITLDGQHTGPVFDGVGAISGGGGNSRLLIDYPPAQRRQILNYLFGPGGADLQLLKLEIGGDADSSDGAEPSVEHSQGSIDCDSGYEWWLAEQAVARDPAIKLYGLQWAAPGWVGSIWDKDDTSYVIDWLNCARSHHLTITYLGGWNEHGYNIAWYEDMRAALNANGYRSVQIVADDAHPTENPYDPASAWADATAAAGNPAFKATIGVLAGHDTCDSPTDGYHCFATAAARKLGRPLWESELGAMDANTGAADMVRSINNGYIQAGITGYLEWPLMDSMPPGLPYENRGLVTADQPWSGNYMVNRMTWAIAQTTQFTEPGWRHLAGANRAIGDSGTYNSYEAPNKRDWSLVAENTSHFTGQHVAAQKITVHVTGGLTTSVVHVWATNLWSADPATWFVRKAAIHPKAGVFSYTIPAGDVVSFTSTTGQSHYQAGSPPAAAPLKQPYQASADGSAEATYLASLEGAFSYEPCLGGASGDCIGQLADQQPVWWQVPTAGLPTPYAIVGSSTWANYTVSARVLFTPSGGTVSLIGRYGSQGGDAALFTGYEFDLQANGQWHITRNSNVAAPQVLTSGSVAALAPDVWYTISFTLNGPHLSAAIDGTTVGHQVTNSRWTEGLAGIGSSWNLVQFDGLTVS
jgi:hypothetical protein